jgi:RNA polymerase sigma factor (TIGR02999 family)
MVRAHHEAVSASADEQGTNELLTQLYHELRRLAAAQLGRERPGQTLQPTALVHEAYVRLQRSGDAKWDSEGHFLVAAAEAMRRILVESARRRHAQKRGGDRRRIDLTLAEPEAAVNDEQLTAISDALDELEMHDPAAAALVKLRYFGGLKHGEAAEALGIARRAADRLWATARAWLFAELSSGE